MVKWLKLKQNKNTSITNTKTIRDKTKQITSELKKRITSLREEIKKKKIKQLINICKLLHWLKNNNKK